MMGDFGKGIKSFKQGMNEETDRPVGPPPAQLSQQVPPPVAPQPVPTEQQNNGPVA
jgi:sec-independent protein translocase protein TatA